MFQTLAIECVDGLVKPQEFLKAFFGYSCTCVNVTVAQYGYVREGLFVSLVIDKLLSSPALP